MSKLDLSSPSFFHFGLDANFGVIFDHFEFCPHDFHPL